MESGSLVMFKCRSDHVKSVSLGNQCYGVDFWFCFVFSSSVSVDVKSRLVAWS